MEVVYSLNKMYSSTHPLIYSCQSSEEKISSVFLFYSRNNMFPSPYLSHLTFFPTQPRRKQYLSFLEGNPSTMVRSIHGSHVIVLLGSGVGLENWLDESFKCFQFLKDSEYMETVEEQIYYHFYFSSVSQLLCLHIFIPYSIFNIHESLDIIFFLLL